MHFTKKIEPPLIQGPQKSLAMSDIDGKTEGQTDRQTSRRRVTHHKEKGKYVLKTPKLGTL